MEVNQIPNAERPQIKRYCEFPGSSFSHNLKSFKEKVGKNKRKMKNDCKRKLQKSLQNTNAIYSINCTT